MPEPNFAINFTAEIIAASECEVGDLLVYDSAEGYWEVATTANRAAADAGAQAVALTDYGGSGVGKVAYQSTGVVAAEVTGLSSGYASRTLVRTSATGRFERIASYSTGDDVVGYAEKDGRVKLHMGLPWEEIAAIAGIDGKTVKAMADADQTLGSEEANKSLYEATGALTAARALNVPAVASAATAYRRTVQHSGEDNVLLVGTATGTQQVAVRPGHRASVEFTPAGAYAIHEKPLDPRDFGCKWDGVTDDAPAFQAMLDSLPANNLFPVRIRLPAGRVWFSTHIYVKRVVIIEGEGATIWNQKNDTVYTPHYSVYGTVIRSAPGMAGFIFQTAADSDDGGSSRGSQLRGFSMHGTKVIPSTTGSHGRNVMSIDPTYDTRANSTAYAKGRLLLRTGTTTTGSGTFDEGATRGGTRVAFRVTTGGTTASSAPAAIAAATTADIGTTITDGTCVLTVESIPKDYEHSRSYVVGEKCLIPGFNAVVLECIVAGTSLAAGTNSLSDYGIGTNIPGGGALGINGYEFLDDAGVPSGLKWRTYCPAGALVGAPEVVIEDLAINGYMGAAAHVSSDVGVGGAAYGGDANFYRFRDVESYFCGMGFYIRGSDGNGGSTRDCNFRYCGHSRSDIDSATYLNISGGKWGNGGYAVLDRSLGGGKHYDHYAQFSNAPSWANHKASDTGGFNARFRSCDGETTLSSIVRGLGSYIDCTPIIYQTTSIETGGFVLDSQGNYGRGITEVDMVGYGAKRIQAGLMNQWGDGGAHWFRSNIDEFTSSAFGWGYQTTCIDAGTSGTGWYTLGYGQYYRRTAFSLGGAKSTEGLGHIRFDRGFFLGNETDGARYVGPMDEKLSTYVRGGRRLVGDLFVDLDATSGYSEQRVTVAGYEGRTWASFSGAAAITVESGTSPYNINSVALAGDMIKLTGGRVVRVTAKTGDGNHPVAEPALASLVTPGDTEVVNTGTANITYYYVGDEPTYTNAGYLGTISTGAPTNATYVTLSNNGTLTDERVLTAGTGISISDGGAGSTVTVSSTVTGESTTASNLGAGSQVFKQLSTYDLQFRSLVAGSNITLTQNTNDITIAATAGTISGTDTHVMFFDGANNPAGEAGFTYAKATDTVTLAGAIKLNSSAASTGYVRLGGTGTTTQVAWYDGTLDVSIVTTNVGSGLVLFGDASNYASVLQGDGVSALAAGGNYVLKGVAADSIRCSQPLGGDEDTPSSLALREASVTCASSPSNTTISDAEAACPIIYLSGTTGHGPDIIFPNRPGATWWVYNGASGGVYIKVGGTSHLLGAGNKGLYQVSANAGFVEWINVAI